MRKLVFILLMLIGLSFMPPNLTGRDEISHVEVEVSKEMILRDNIVNRAKEYIGVPYTWGGNSPHSFDCSGFTQYVFKMEGMEIPRTSLQQYYFCKHVERKRMDIGDLVFFSKNRKPSGIYHVGIITEVDSSGHGYMFIHSVRGGVRISPSILYERVFFQIGKPF